MASSPDLPADASDQGVTLPSPAEACRLAVNLAGRTGWKLIPVQESKQPRVKGWDKLATSDPEELRKLWRRFPDPLIGIATGVASGVWVLDIDVKHQTAIDWWQAHNHLLLPTRAYRTRSGGFHCYYTGADGLRNSVGRPVHGIDVRGDGGYAVFWFAAGLECLDDSPPAPWPAWLRRRVAPPVVAAGRGPMVYQGDPDAGLRGLLDKVASAAEGERNQLLFWAACRLFSKGLKAGEVEGLLLPIAINTGLADPEARRTIASAAQQA